MRSGARRACRRSDGSSSATRARSGARSRMSRSRAARTEIEHEAHENFRPAVGIERGVTATLALSTGEMLSVPAGLERIECAKRRVQRVLSRRRRGSKRYAPQRRRVARLQARAGRIRRDFHHHAALDIARRFGVAAMEDLRIKTMTASAPGTVAEPG